MKTTNITEHGCTIDLSRDEAVILNSALNEAGQHEEDAERVLLRRIHATLEPDNGVYVFDVTLAELELLKDSVIHVLKEIWEWELGTRTGHEFDEIAKVLKEIKINIDEVSSAHIRALRKRGEI
jgi:hypothetical protein